MMGYRLKLTKIDKESVESDSSEQSENNEPNYDPSIRFKEHYLSHFAEDIQNLAPLPLLNTGRLSLHDIDIDEASCYVWHIFT